MKKLLVLLLVLVAVPSVSAKLADNTNYAIQSNNQECFDLSIPEDFGVIDTRVTFTLDSDCGEWCDFTKSILTTDNTNPVVIPVCINAKDRQSGDRKSFSLNMLAQGRQKTYNFGVCVYDIPDKDIGSGDPCGVTNIKQDNFDISINPNPIYIKPGQTLTYEISVYSQESFNLEIDSSTGKKWNVKTEPKKSVTITDNLEAVDGTLTVTGRIVNSPVPGDTKTVSAPVYVTSQNPPGDFAVSLTPENINTEVNDVVNYELEIDNFGDPKNFTIEIIVPEEFKTEFERKTETISGKKTFNFQITPTKSVSKSFRVIVSSEDGTKSKQPFISIDEISTDIGRTRSTENPPSNVRKCLSQQNVQNTGKTIGSQVDSWGSFIECTRESEKPSEPIVTTTPGLGGSNPLLIIAPIIIIVTVLFYYFYKKKKPVEDNEDEYY